MAAGDLVALVDAQTWAGANATAQLVTAASTQIQAYLGFQVGSQTYTRRFNGSGGDSLVLPDRPLTAIATLSVDGIAIPPSNSALQPGYVFDDKTVFLIGSRFWRGMQNVVVAYTAGYAVIPADIQQACLILVKTVMDRAARESDLVEERAGDTAFTYNRQNKSDKLGLLPSDVLALVGPYRRVAPC